MPTPQRPAISLDALCGLPLSALRTLAGDEMMKEALPILRERLDLTPAKLALLMLRIIGPDELPTQEEEATLRGVTPKTLRGMKERGEIPKTCGGIPRG